jgi:hypothetical protein
VAFGAGVPAQANLIINPTFDSSITGNANATQIEATINQAISFFEATYTNSITGTIDFRIDDFGSWGSQVANNPANGTTQIWVKSADLRAVGLAGGPLCNVTGAAGTLTCSTTAGGTGAVDGIIGLNTSITSPPSAESGNYDLPAVTEHEIDEVLGLRPMVAGCDSTNGCTGSNAGNPAPEDLFSYTAKNVRASLNVNCAAITQAYFSYSGAVNIANLNTACNGGDFGDWQGINGDPQVQDAYATAGQLVPYGSSELAAMSAIGYTPAPEPATWLLLLSSAGVLAIARRRMSL